MGMVVLFVALAFGYKEYEKLNQVVFCPDSLSPTQLTSFIEASSCEAFKGSELTYDECKRYKNCKRCPDKGWCSEGQLRCNPGHVREGNICIENKKLIHLSINMIKLFATYLAEVRGNYVCRQRTNYHVSFQQFVEILEKEFDNLNDDSLTFTEFKHKVIDMLNNKDSEESIRDEDIQIMEKNVYNNKITDFNMNDIQFYSNSEIFTLSCSISTFFRNNLFSIIMVVVLSSYGG